MKISKENWEKVRKVMKISEENLKKSEESYEDKWGNLCKNKIVWG